MSSNGVLERWINLTWNPFSLVAAQPISTQGCCLDILQVTQRGLQECPGLFCYLIFRLSVVRLIKALAELPSRFNEVRELFPSNARIRVVTAKSLIWKQFLRIRFCKLLKKLTERPCQSVMYTKEKSLFMFNVLSSKVFSLFSESNFGYSYNQIKINHTDHHIHRQASCHKHIKVLEMHKSNVIGSLNLRHSWPLKDE